MNLPDLTISLLGGVRISQNGTAVSGFASRKADALFVYLVCNPRSHPREILATLFWPDNEQSRALANLSVALSSLRSQLGEYLLTDRHTISINHEMEFWLDVAEFERAIKDAQARQPGGQITRTTAAQLQTAVALYKGDFLAGFAIRGAPEFEAWALLEQERLRQLMLDALADLVNFHQQRGQLSKGIRQAQRLLALDPLQEEMHRQLMQLYALDNQRPAALAQYEQCAAVLAEELGVEPDEETTALYLQIRDDRMTAEQGGKENSSAFSPRHNLPVAATAFIGREAEIAHVDSWLGEANGRLLTIVGPGGIGKTRLALEAARAHLGAFADGVWMISLVAFEDWAGAVMAIAEALGLTLAGQEPSSAQLIKQLQPLEALLVLDNLEHLLNDELRDLLSQLTRTAPDLRLIVTSRERLRLQAERLLVLNGLPFPAARTPATVSGRPFAASDKPYADYPAVQLFNNRVQRLQPDFVLAGKETAVAELCQLVEGLPLALELAATWTRVLAVEEIVAELRRSLNALSTTLHDVPQRHRSLRAVIEASWELLDLDEQILFRQLAVFRGGFTRTAAQAVANARLPQLMSLVDRSFLRLDEDQRFRRHPLLLQFALEQLAALPDEQAKARAAHADFFVEFVSSKEALLKGKDAPVTLAEMGAELENIRAAWQWALQPLRAAHLEKLISGVSLFFADRSRFLEGLELFESTLQRLMAQPKTAVRDQIVTQVQVELGYFLYQTGQFAQAEQVLLEANEQARHFGLLRTRLHCLKHLGDVLHDHGDRPKARTYLHEALRLCEETEEADTHLKMILLNTLGNLEVDAGNFDEAHEHYEACMALAKTLDNTLRLAILHNNIAIIANRQNKFDEAIHRYQMAFEGFKENNHEWGMAATTHNIGMVYADLEQFDQALTYIENAYAAHEKIGHRRGMVGGLSMLGTIYRKQGRRRKARRHYYDSLTLAQEVGVAWAAIATLVDVAELELSYGRTRRAALLLSFAVLQEASEATTLEKAKRLLADLKAEIPETLYTEAATAAAQHTLDSLIAHLTKDKVGNG